jgi:S-formylglutathione hydrolase FrmB
MNDPASSPSGAGAAAGHGPEQLPGSPHTRRYVILRILGAILIIGVAITVERLWLRDEPSRNTFGATVRTKEIDSTALGRTMPVKVVVPKGAPANGRGLVVFLHGRGEDESSYLVEPMFEALASLKTRAPVIAFPDGGDSSYWHDRDTGDWSSYVLKDVIPKLVGRFDIDPSKIAIGGISMGGFGAYDIARLDPGRFCAVGGHSPALWTSASDTADGAFDNAGDFDANNVIDIAGSAAKPYNDMKLWIDAGDDDPFLDADSAFEDALKEAGAHVVVKSGNGGHDLGYWNGNWDEYLGWYAHVLKGCGLEAEHEAKHASGKSEGTGRAKTDETKPAEGPNGNPSGPSSPGAGSGASPGG